MPLHCDRRHDEKRNIITITSRRGKSRFDSIVIRSRNYSVIKGNDMKIDLFDIKAILCSAFENQSGLKTNQSGINAVLNSIDCLGCLDTLLDHAPTWLLDY